MIGSEHNQNPNSTKNLFVFEINKFKIRCKRRLHKSKNETNVEFNLNIKTKHENQVVFVCLITQTGQQPIDKHWFVQS